MVRRIVLLMFLVTGTMPGFGQVNNVVPVAPNFPGFTFRWTGGYGWGPIDNQDIPAPVINTLSPSVNALTGFGPLTNISAAGATPQVVHNSFGHGFNVGLRFGYMFNQYLGVDMGVSYSQSKTISAYQQTIFYQPDTGSTSAPTGGYLDYSVTTKSLSVSVSPCITLAYSKPKFKFYPYLRAGVTLPVFTQVQHNLGITMDGAGPTQTSYAAPYFLGQSTTGSMYTNMFFTVGATGAVGVVWRPVNFVNFFAEVNGQYLNQKASYTLITAWTADGIDLTPGMGAYRLETIYEKSLNSHSNNIYYNANYNVNSPKQDISPVFPYSYIGFNLGVQLVLSKKVFKDQDGFDQYRGPKVKSPAKKKKKKKKVEEVKPGATS